MPGSAIQTFQGATKLFRRKAAPGEKKQRKNRKIKTTGCSAGQEAFSSFGTPCKPLLRQSRDRWSKKPGGSGVTATSVWDSAPSYHLKGQYVLCGRLTSWSSSDVMPGSHRTVWAHEMRVLRVVSNALFTPQKLKLPMQTSVEIC